jgi:hypothetical protein
VKGKLSVQGLEGCQASGSPTMQSWSYTVDHPRRVPVLKVCYFLDCLCIAEIVPAFKVNTEILA